MEDPELNKVSEGKYPKPYEDVVGVHIDKEGVRTVFDTYMYPDKSWKNNEPVQFWIKT